MQQEKSAKEVKGLTFKPKLRNSKSPLSKSPRMTGNLVNQMRAVDKFVDRMKKA